MKMVCNRGELLTAVFNVQRAVAAKSLVSALEGILLEIKKDSVKLTGYDLEIGITTVLEARADEERTFILDARLFGDMLKRLPDEFVTIECDEKLTTVIHSGKVEYAINAIPADEYPEMPVIEEGSTITMSKEILKSMIKQTIFAVDSQVNPNRPIYSGTLFEFSKDSIRLVSVDGCRLAMRTEPVQCNEEMRFVIPGKTLNEILKLLDEEESQISISVGKRHIIFDIDGYNVVSRLLEGDFLDYNTAIPEVGTTQVIVKTRDFIESVERVSLLINERVKSPVRCIIDEGMIRVSCVSTIGKAYDELSAKIDGGKIEIGFNNRLLLDALRASECDEVRIELIDSLSPMKILPMDGDQFLFLVLPVRLKHEG